MGGAAVVSSISGTAVVGELMDLPSGVLAER
jgi:hypothetical protein